ncbi:putative serine/threonine-protein kinase [Physcomitrium patens]|uniref:putative serine/threonine-protein kinase n=1 Tax=Physcomitrium patens TaxID=3218 RepID=UPI003CCC9AE6
MGFSLSGFHGSTTALMVSFRKWLTRQREGNPMCIKLWKGELASSQNWAVFDRFCQENSKQGAREFLNEVVVISGVKRRNLVKLRGCCVEGRHRLQVYEYMENRSLRQALLGKSLSSSQFDNRFFSCIALGTARGLVYLHYEITPRIIHRGMKTNILLDRNLEAKIADFGLAKLFSEEQSHYTTKVAGTLTRVCCTRTCTPGLLTEKVDVYGYGIVLMEIVTGEVNMKRTPSGSLLFLIKVSRFHLNLKHEAFFTNQLDHSRFRKTAFNWTALLCTLDKPELRLITPRIVPMLLRSEPIAEDDLQPLVKIEYSRSLYAADCGVNEEWSSDETPNDPPLINGVSPRH